VRSINLSRSTKNNPPSFFFQGGSIGPQEKREVEELVKEVTLEEALSNVWEKFEKALTKLEPREIGIFEKYLKGKAPKEIGQEEGLSEKEVISCIEQLKRQLNRHLRKDWNMKN